MRKLLVASLLMFNAGCTNLTFDNLEYSRFVDIKYLADQKDKICDDPILLDKTKASIKEMIDVQVLYSKFKGENSYINSSALSLQNIISSFSDRNEMSKEYCVSKLENVGTATALILDTLGGM